MFEYADAINAYLHELRTRLMALPIPSTLCDLLVSPDSGVREDAISFLPPYIINDAVRQNVIEVLDYMARTDPDSKVVQAVKKGLSDFSFSVVEVEKTKHMRLSHEGKWLRQEGSGSPEDVAYGNKELIALRHLGIHIVPFEQLLSHRGVYKWVDIVQGVNVGKIWPQVSTECIAEVDLLYAALAMYVSDRMVKNKPFLYDIFTLDQYMFGTIHGDANPHVYLVDLDYYIATTNHARCLNHDVIAYALNLERQLGEPKQFKILHEVLQGLPFPSGGSIHSP